jgi:UDP-N-acetylmuramate-alanine ligase
VEVWIIWEPITRSRLACFAPAFANAFASAAPKAVIVGPVNTTREEQRPEQDQKLLIDFEICLKSALQKEGTASNSTVVISESWSCVNERLLHLLAKEGSSEENIVVLFMGAGRVTHAAHAFAESLLEGVCEETNP